VSFFNNTTTGPAEKPNAHAIPNVEVTPCEAAYATAMKPTIRPTMVMADFGDERLRRWGSRDEPIGALETGGE
jgi:hypothetical protein